MNDPEIFGAQLGTMFLIQREADSVALQLVDVADEHRGRGIQQYTLFFHGPADRALPQGTYEFYHDVLGSLALFIVPVVGSTHERIVYQACFSRPAPANNAAL